MIANLLRGSALLVLAPTAAAQVFSAPDVVATAHTGVWRLATGDLDADGDVDFVTSGSSGGVASTAAVRAYFNDGTGAFSAPVAVWSTSGASAQDVELLDSDGDGDLDVVFLAGDELLHVRNLGNGTFTTASVLSSNLIALDPTRIEVGDVDSDGFDDVVLLDEGFTGRILWFRCDGAGGFGPATAVDLAAGDVSAAALADFDGDGHVDLAAARTVGPYVHIYRGGTNGFGPAQDSGLPPLYYPDSLVAADLDGDGDVDLAVSADGTAYGNRATWYENDGAGQFAPTAELEIPFSPALAMTAADLSGDGVSDLVWSDASEVRWRSVGPATVSGPRPILATGFAPNIGAADFDGDGDTDILAGGNTMLVLLARNIGSVATAYCAPAVEHSGSVPAGMDTAGSVVLANDSLTLRAYSLPSSPQESVGFFLASRTPGQIAGVGGTPGTLCLGGSILRLNGPGQVKVTTNGAFDVTVQPSTFPASARPAVGETWYFQCWFRDSVLSTANLTHGISVTFQ